MKHTVELSVELMRDITKQMMYKANHNIQELGLTAEQGKLLRFLAEYEEEKLIQKEIAVKFKKTTASMGAMLRSLEREGFIKRYIPDDNTRQKYVKVLEKGSEVIKHFDDKNNELNREMESLLTEKEFQQLNQLLHKFNDQIKAI